MNNIETLLEQYFEGQTSVEEEATLRQYFSLDSVPEHLEMYRPLFVYFDGEIKRTEAEASKSETDSMIQVVKGGNVRPAKENKKLLLWISGAAACAAVFFGVLFSISPAKTCPTSGNYVMINGQCYTDIETIRNATLKSLQEVANDDIGFSDEESFNPANIIENQLKEFDSFFNE